MVSTGGNGSCASRYMAWIRGMAMRYCTNCGAEVADGQRFCRKCGTPVRTSWPVPSESVEGAGNSESPDDGVTEQTEKMLSSEGATQTATQTKEEAHSEDPAALFRPSELIADSEDSSDDGSVQQIPAPRRRRKVAAIVAALLVVLVAAGGAALYFGGGQHFPWASQAEAQPLSRSVRIVPKTTDGSTPLHYFVRVKRAVDTSGNEIDVSAAPVIEVSDGEGFTPGDLITDLPDGAYTFEIEADEDTFELPPIDLSENGKGESGETIEIGPSDEDSATTEEAPKTAEALFLEKIEELIATYGEPVVKVAERPDDQYGDYIAYPAGLSFAELIDFGDGVERLVVIYYDGDNQGTPNYSNYYLEVWEYDTETNELVCVCGENQASPLSTSSFDESAGTLSIRANKDKTVIKYESFVDLSSVELYLSLPNDDSAFIHYIETTGKTEGTTVVRTSRVDGREVSEEELNEITSAIYGNWKFDTYRWYSLTEYYDSETEAQGGLKPDDAAEQNVGEYYYPGDMVQQVYDTIEALQDRLSDEQSTQDDDGAAEVAVEEVTETVEVPTFTSGYDRSDGVDQATWGYLVLTDGASDEAMSKINEVLRKEYEDVKQETVNLKSFTVDSGECTSYRSLLTCNRDGLLGTYTEQYRTNWGPHGWTKVSGHIFDLSTGEELEPWEVAGMSDSELDDTAVEVIASYAMDNPGLTAYASEEEARSDASMILDNCEYLLTNDGIVVSLPEYAMRYSYAEGSLKIVVWAFDDPSLVGTNVMSQFTVDYLN